MITHAGTGAIIGAVTKGKKVIAIPRLKKYGEHVDDHQLEILKQFEEIHIICPCYSCDDLKEVLNEIEDIKLNAYPSNTERMIDELDYVIKELLINKAIHCSCGAKTIMNSFMELAYIFGSILVIN